MIRPALLITTVLMGCATVPAPAPAPAPTIPPQPTGNCPAAGTVPAAPPAPRTVEAVARYATRLDEALVRSHRARAACAHSLDELRAWIADRDLHSPR